MVTSVFLSSGSFPESERETVFQITSLLMNLRVYIKQYATALSLHAELDAECDDRSKRRAAILSDPKPNPDPASSLSWNLGSMGDAVKLAQEQADLMDKMSVPIRDSVMTVHHFWQTLEAINFKDSPTLISLVDHPKLRDARRLFKEKFTDSEKARNAVAHSAELTASKEAREKNAISQGYSSENIKIAPGPKINMSVIDQNSFVGTIATPHVPSEVVVSTLSTQSLSALKEVAETAYLAFKPVVDEGLGTMI